MLSSCSSWLCCRALSAPAHCLGPLPAPLPACLCNSSPPASLTPLQVRVGTMLRLLSIKWLCFLILEADNWMRVSGRSPLALGHDLAMAAGLGAALPVAVAVLLEVSEHINFKFLLLFFIQIYAFM